MIPKIQYLMFTLCLFLTNYLQCSTPNDQNDFGKILRSTFVYSPSGQCRGLQLPIVKKLFSNLFQQENALLCKNQNLQKEKADEFARLLQQHPEYVNASKDLIFPANSEPIVRMSLLSLALWGNLDETALMISSHPNFKPRLYLNTQTLPDSELYQIIKPDCDYQPNLLKSKILDNVLRAAQNDLRLNNSTSADAQLHRFDTYHQVFSHHGYFFDPATRQLMKLSPAE